MGKSNRSKKNGKGRAPASRPKSNAPARRPTAPQRQQTTTEPHEVSQPTLPGGYWAEFREEWAYFIPPPEAMNAYDDDTRQFFMDEVRLQSAHRRKIETKVINSDAFRATSGQVLGAVMFISVVVGAVILGLNEQPLLAGTLVAIDVGGFGGAFVYGNKRKARQVEEKRSHR